MFHCSQSQDHTLERHACRLAQSLASACDGAAIDHICNAHVSSDTGHSWQRGVQLVKGLVLLNATPFWTVYNSRAFARSGTVPLPPAVAAFVSKRIFARVAAPDSVRELLGQVLFLSAMCCFCSVLFCALVARCWWCVALATQRASVRFLTVACVTKLACVIAGESVPAFVCISTPARCLPVDIIEWAVDDDFIGRVCAAAQRRHCMHAFVCTVTMTARCLPGVPNLPHIACSAHQPTHAHAPQPTHAHAHDLQVYINEGAVDDELVGRICAAAQHPHAADAFVSMMTAPRGAKELSAMVAELTARGMPVCMLHGVHLVVDDFDATL